MKLLLTGDLHLGRTSTRLPPSRREMGRAISGWKRLVDAAVTEGVQAVILSGDVLDESDAFWEASGPFSQGIDNLAQAGIHTYAVAGNHDALILPRLAAGLSPEAFTLLGTGGRWERVTLEENGAPVLHLDGWSFKTTVQRTDPARDYPALPADGLPVLGVVHGDPGAADSSYAPLSISHLQSLPVDGWLLGHIHKPSLTSGSPWVLMPGSPHPLDPGESDAHHAWILELKDGRLTQPVPFCPASLQYRSVTLSIQEEDTLSYDSILRRLEEDLEQNPFEGFEVLRLTFSGQHPDLDALDELTRSLPEWEHPQACIESVRVDTTSPLDVGVLRKAGPVPSRLVQALDAPMPGLEERFAQVIRDLNHRREFRESDLPDFTREDLPVSTLLETTLRAVKEHLDD